MKNLHLYARLTSVLILGIIILALFYGRYLQNTYYWMLPLIPIIGMASISGIIIVIWYKLRSAGVNYSCLQILRTITPIAALGLLAAALCERLIELPIERVHFVKYSLFSMFVFLSHRDRMRIRATLQTLLVGSTIGILDEFSQRFIPNRFFDFRDILLNLCAVATGVLIISSATYLCPKNSTNG